MFSLLRLMTLGVFNLDTAILLVVWKKFSKFHLRAKYRDTHKKSLRNNSLRATLSSTERMVTVATHKKHEIQNFLSASNASVDQFKVWDSCATQHSNFPTWHSFSNKRSAVVLFLTAQRLEIPYLFQHLKDFSWKLSLENFSINPICNSSQGLGLDNFNPPYKVNL